MTKKISKTSIAATKLLTAASDLGWKVFVRNGTILTIGKTITPNDDDSFSEADMEYSGILSLAPQTQAGSIWGTDGGGMGGHAAMKSGSFVMNMSGVSKRFLSALSKQLAVV